MGQSNAVVGSGQLLNDIHHLTFITADLDRLIAFYERVFEARVTVDLEEDGLRHAFIEVGRTLSCTLSRCPESSLPSANRCSTVAGWITSP